MAVVSSSALRKVFVKRGERERERALTLLEKPPRYAPLERWALNILSASSKRMGINLRESDAIRENSDTGIPNFLNGFKSHSIAFMIPLCGVVDVNSEAESIMTVSLSIRRALAFIPSRVIAKGPIIVIGSPGVKEILKSAVRKKSHRKGKRDLII